MRAAATKRSVFVKLLCVFLAVVTPMYVLAYGIYSWGRSMTRTEITNSLRSSVAFYMRTLNAEIARIRALQYECLNDEDLFYFVNASHIMTQHQRFQALLSLQRRLSIMNDSSSYISDVTVYLPRNGRTISSKRGVDPLSDRWKQIVTAKADSSEAGIIYQDNRLFLCAAYPQFPVDPTATPLFILIIELSADAIREFLLPFNLYADGGVALMNAEQHYLLVESANQAVAEQMLGDNSVAQTIRDLGEATLALGREQYLAVGDFSEYLNMNLISYIPQHHIYQGIWRYQAMFWAFTAMALLVVAGFALASYLLIKRPMNRLVSALRRIEGGDLSERIEHQGNDEYAYLYNSFNGMAAALENLFEMNYKQQLLTQKAELRQLQAQINPHFLYNSFFILYRMAKDEDYETITAFLKYLTDYYRFITRDALTEVPLEQEVTHAYNYAAIQQLRFGKRIAMEMPPLPEAAKQIPVPRLILQPVLENACDHGLRHVAEGGRLSVSFECRGGEIRIHVENNGPPLPAGELEALARRLEETGDWMECTGIVNIHRRLRLKFGPQSGLRLAHGSDGGLRVTLVLFAEAAKEE